MPAVVRLRAPAQSPPRPRRAPATRRPRTVTAGPAAFLAAIVLLIAVVAGNGSAEPAPATGAASIVPADALAYVHLSIDPSRPAVQRALALAGRFPEYAIASAAVQARLGAVVGASSAVDYARDIRPWLGKEAALALLSTPTATAGTLIVLDVRDHSEAQTFLRHAGATAAGTYRGIRLLRYASGTEAAFVSHYLALGQDAAVRAAIDTARSRSSSLQANPVYERAAAGEPADRVLDAYASQTGVRVLLAARRGIVGSLGTLLDQPALAGATVSLSPAKGGARVKLHSALDPSLVGLHGSRPAPFTPSLQSVIPSGSTAMLDVTGLDKLAPQILNAGAVAGIAGGVGPLLQRLGAALASEGVNLQGLTSIFRGESAVAIGSTNAHTPSLVIVARTHDEARTRTTLAALEAPLAQLFSSTAASAGQAPVFNDRQVAGVTVHQLSLAPGLELDYAVSGGLVIVSTSMDAASAVVERSRSLADDPGYRATLSSHPQRVTSLLFLDFSQLLSLGEQTGLTRSARFTALRADLDKIRAVGLDSTGGEADSTAELFLQIP
jgi:hypothetical protein